MSPSFKSFNQNDGTISTSSKINSTHVTYEMSANTTLFSIDWKRNVSIIYNLDLGIIQYYEFIDDFGVYSVETRHLTLIDHHQEETDGNGSASPSPDPTGSATTNEVSSTAPSSTTNGGLLSMIVPNAIYLLLR